jgi:hypothetical protein
MMLDKYGVLLAEAIVSVIGFIVFIAIHPIGWTYASVAIAFIAADGVKGISALVNKSGVQITSQMQQTANSSAVNNNKPPG